MKKVLSLAIAAALVAPAAAMAEATLFGKAHFVIQNVDDNDNTGVKHPVTSTETSEVGDVWSVDSIHSRIGVKGSEDLGNGLTGVYHFEFKVNQDSGDGLGDRNQFIGLAGGFGTMLLGRHDTPLKMSQGAFDQFGDLPYGDIYSVIPGEDRVDNVIAYVSPAFGGVTLVGALVAGEEGDAATIAGIDAFPELTGFADHYSLAGLYSNGPIFASLAYNQYDLGGTGKLAADVINANYGTNYGGGANPTILRGTFIWDGGMWTAGAMYSSMDLDLEALGLKELYNGTSAPALDSDATSWGLSGSIKVGPSGKIKAQYLSGDGITGSVNELLDNVADDLAGATAGGFSPSVTVASATGVDTVNQFSIGYEHALSSSTTLHAGYTSYTAEFKPDVVTNVKSPDHEVDALFAGMIMNF